MATLAQPSLRGGSFSKPKSPISQPETSNEPVGTWTVAGSVALCVLLVTFFAFVAWLAANSPPRESSPDEDLNWYIGP